MDLEFKLLKAVNEVKPQNNFYENQDFVKMSAFMVYQYVYLSICIHTDANTHRHAHAHIHMKKTTDKYTFSPSLPLSPMVIYFIFFICCFIIIPYSVPLEKDYRTSDRLTHHLSGEGLFPVDESLRNIAYTESKL